MPRPTGLGYALLALAATTYLGARLVGAWELYLLAFTFVMVVVLGWLTVTFVGRRIHVTRTMDPDHPVAGDRPEMLSLVKNVSFVPGPRLTLRSDLATMASGVAEHEVRSLGPRGQDSHGARVGRVNRGVHLLPAAQALTEDPLGVACAVRKVSEPLAVTVLPRIALLQSCALQPSIGLRHSRGARHSLQMLGASDFRGVRPHQPGEPLSHIDWKSTAKTGSLMLRETDEPAGADATLLLDGTAAELAGETADSNFELAVQAAGSIADFVLRAGLGVNLIRHERSWRRQRLTADEAGRRALLQTLAEAQPDASTPLATALRQLRTGGARMSRAERITIVSISLDSLLEHALVDLRQEGLNVAFLYVVGSSFPQAPPGAASYLEPFLQQHEGSSTAALTAENRALLMSLSAAGIPCQTLSRGEDLVRRLSLWDSAGESAAALR